MKLRRDYAREAAREVASMAPRVNEITHKIERAVVGWGSAASRYLREHRVEIPPAPPDPDPDA